MPPRPRLKPLVAENLLVPGNETPREYAERLRKTGEAYSSKFSWAQTFLEAARIIEALAPPCDLWRREHGQSVYSDNEEIDMSGAAESLDDDNWQPLSTFPVGRKVRVRYRDGHVVMYSDAACSAWSFNRLGIVAWKPVDPDLPGDAPVAGRFKRRVPGEQLPPPPAPPDKASWRPGPPPIAAYGPPQQLQLKRALDTLLPQEEGPASPPRMKTAPTTDSDKGQTGSAPRPARVAPQAPEPAQGAPKRPRLADKPKGFFD
jgi:hypothetical protein